MSTNQKSQEEDKKELYLEEDKDILEQISNLNRIDEYMTKMRRLALLQIKALLRNRKSLEDFSKKTKRFSILLVMVATIQVVIAICHFIFLIQTSDDKWFGLVWIIILVTALYVIIKQFEKIIESD